jgi:putative sterol carrier protein
MTDATTEFFEELSRRDHEPLLEKITETIRFDLVEGSQIDHWFVAIDKGDVTVSQQDGAADVVVTMDKKLFDSIAAGETNAVAATLRGAMRLEGDWSLLVRFQRLFRGRPRAARRQRPTEGRRR